MTRKKSFKTTIPWELQIALIKQQGRMESTYEEACIRASQLLDPNSKEFEKAVADEIRKMEKSQIMSKVNKSRKTWTEKGYKQGFKKGEAEHKIVYSCSVCNGQLVMKPGENDHIVMKKMMSDGGWAHSSCHNAKKTR